MLRSLDKIEKKKVQMNTINTLNLLNFLSPRIQEFINLAFSNGGYIAGGFANQLAKVHFDKNHDIKSYLCYGGGDVDLYFQNGNMLNQFKEATKIEFNEPDLKNTDWVENHYMQSETRKDYDPKIKIQLIKAFFRPVDEMFETFDISNACVAYHDQKLIFEDLKTWQENENSKTVHVKHWGQWTFARVAKYLVLRDYSMIHNDCKNEFVKQLGEKQVRKNQGVFDKIKNSLSIGDLLFISSLCNDRCYDKAFELITKKSNKKFYDQTYAMIHGHGK